MAKSTPAYKAHYHTRYKVSSSKVIAYKAVIAEEGSKPRRVFSPRPTDNTTSGFSKQAHKRMSATIDNLVCQFKAMSQLNEEYMFYELHGVKHRRKLVMCTLTMPEQAISDAEVKRNILGNLLEVAKKSYGMRQMIWKAEPQERGVIHFHIVWDAFFPEARLRYLWFRSLVRWGCNGEYKTCLKFSKGVHFKVIDDLETAPQLISGYFEGETDENGLTIHKHDASKRVRNVNGRNWGCTDNLRYRQMTIFDIIPEVEEDIQNNSLQEFSVEGSKGDVVAHVWLRQQVHYSPKKHKHYYTRLPTKLDRYLLYYHLDFAEETYGGFCRLSPQSSTGSDRRHRFGHEGQRRKLWHHINN